MCRYAALECLQPIFIIFYSYRRCRRVGEEGDKPLLVSFVKQKPRQEQPELSMATRVRVAISTPMMTPIFGPPGGPENGGKSLLTHSLVNKFLRPKTGPLSGTKTGPPISW